jgi:hypothetical protein
MFGGGLVFEFYPAVGRLFIIECGLQPNTHLQQQQHNDVLFKKKKTAIV